MVYIGKANDGRIELITGCMFAGKTEEFIRRITRLKFAKHEVMVFKPVIDDRYSVNEVISHMRLSIPAVAVNESKEILEKLTPNTTVIGVDEVQFFDEQIVEVLEKIANQGIVVIVNGLDKDFKNDPFLNVEKLMIYADFVKKLHAICVKCGNLANRTQRLVNGNPACRTDQVVLIGEKDKYEARCRHCHQIRD